MLARLLTAGLVLVATLSGTTAQTLCDKYTGALFGTPVTSTTESGLVSAVVERAIKGTGAEIATQLGGSFGSVIILNTNPLNSLSVFAAGGMELKKPALSYTVSGINDETNLIAISRRASNGLLYLLGTDGQLYSANIDAAYTTDATTLAATKVGDITNAGSRGNDATGMDFNPKADKLRIVGGAKHYRVDPNTGEPAGPANGTADGTTAGGAFTFATSSNTPQVQGAAYTNDYNNSAATSQYVIESSTGSLYTVPDPNNGTLVLVGSLNLTFTPSPASLDIITAGASNQQQFGLAYFRNPNTGRGLYRVDLTTGAATLIYSFASGANPVRSAVYNPRPLKFGPLNNVAGLVAANSVTLPYFNGQVMYKGNNTVDYTANSTALAGLLQSLTAFFGSSGALNCTASGYPAYTGRNMQAAHANMNINKAAFDYFNTQVGNSATSFGVSAADVASVAALLNSFGRTVPATVNNICTAADCPEYNPNAQTSSTGSSSGTGNAAAATAVSAASLLLAAVTTVFAVRA